MKVYDIPADDPILNEIAVRIAKHATNTRGVRMTDWDWEEINRRGWTVTIDGRPSRVVLDHAEFYEARNRAFRPRPSDEGAIR